jgi:hypothetical protein
LLIHQIHGHLYGLSAKTTVTACNDAVLDVLYEYIKIYFIQWNMHNQDLQTKERKIYWWHCKIIHAQPPAACINVNILELEADLFFDTHIMPMSILLAQML